MLRKLAVALVAASVFAAPVLAETSSTGNQTPAAKPAVTAPAAPAKAAAPTKRRETHQEEPAHRQAGTARQPWDGCEGPWQEQDRRQGVRP